MHGGQKNGKCIKWGPKICRMMRGFQIWPQNSNRITYDPIFGQNIIKNWLKRIFCQLSTVFRPKKGSNGIRFEFGGQMWNFLIILHILSPHLIHFFHFDFLTPLRCDFYFFSRVQARPRSDHVTWPPPPAISTPQPAEQRPETAGAGATPPAPPPAPPEHRCSPIQKCLSFSNPQDPATF